MEGFDMSQDFCPDCGKTADHLWSSGKYDPDGNVFICDDCCKYWGERTDKADLINRSDW